MRPVDVLYTCVAGAGLLLAGALVGAGCLPQDTRAPPSEVLVTFAGSPLVRDGFSTTDGWKVTFERYLISFGNPRLNGDPPCYPYADAGYGRLFDASVLAPQKVGVSYGLGPCDVRVRLGNPNEDTLLGEGATEADKTFMRTPAPDLYNPSTAGIGGVGITVYLKGRATKDAATKTFTFAYRQRRVGLQGCTRVPGTPPQVFGFNGSPVTVDFFAHPEAPFRAHRDGVKKDTWFAPFAKADDLGNKDGDVTLDELNAVLIADVGLLPDDLTDPDAGVTVTPFKTFADFVWLSQFPHVMGLGPDGFCSLNLGRPGGGPG